MRRRTRRSCTGRTWLLVGTPLDKGGTNFTYFWNLDWHRRARAALPDRTRTKGAAMISPVEIEPAPAEMAAHYSAETPVSDWRERLVCSKCGSRHIDMVVTGTKRRGPA